MAALAVIVAFSAPVSAGPWLDGDPGSASLAEAYLQNEGAHKFHLGNDAEVREAAEEAAAKERHLAVNTHTGAHSYSELANYAFRGGYNRAEEFGLGRYPYISWGHHGTPSVSGTLYGEYMSAKTVLLKFFAARIDNLNRIQQFHLDNNSIYQKGNFNNWK